MDHTTFRFADLPIELALLVFKYAARPIFDQAQNCERDRAYSSAVKLCLVSKAVRRAVLPELLHTILLSRSQRMRLFMQALLMQEEYKKANSDLQYQYAPRVRKMWIGDDGSDPRLPPDHLEYALQPSKNPHFISLLSPIMLAAPSLAFNRTTSISLFMKCLEHAWKFRPATPVDEEHSQLPWNTKSLALFGGHPIDTQWTDLTNTPQGAAFLASICQLVSPKYLSRDYLWVSLAKDYPLPQWVGTVPLAAFKSLQTVISPYQPIIPPVRFSELQSTGYDMHLQVLTLPATLLRAQTGIPNAMKGFVDVLPGQKFIQKDDTSLKVSNLTVRWHRLSGWERIWACTL
ncbi:hypothetical protein P692DRAFT_20246636 [Suillus brevipes Sb2]|nr:hypothetical protein P692DRAFT_20246636 [Suillus brevipes Sb2]